LFFFGGLGAYFGSEPRIVDGAQWHSNEFWDEGSDVWAFDLVTEKWAWVAGGSLGFNPAVSNSPSAEQLSPGAYADGNFGCSNNGNLWLIGRGSQRTFWLWLFNSIDLQWIPYSQIGVSNTPAFQRAGGINQIGSNVSVITAGYGLNDSNYEYDFRFRFQDSWTFYIPTKSWNLVSGPYYDI
jgi:hypothetical protein